MSLDLTEKDQLEGHWDFVRIEQVITNILNNSLKYGGKTPIKVSIFRESDFAAVSIKDSGPGIPKEFHKKIFTQFERLNDNSFQKGLGLGLFICKEIVERHDGRIELVSDANQGAEFIVKLPL